MRHVLLPTSTVNNTISVGCILCPQTYAPIAQLVEQRSLKSQVVGSNPTNSTIAAFLGWGRISGPAPLPINWACGEAE